MDWREEARHLWKSMGGALIGPLVLVGGTGLLLLFVYRGDPATARDHLAALPMHWQYLRSIHLWSSRALLAGAVIHILWVWHDRRVAGPYRGMYLTGAFLLLLLVLEHLTGHVLRWGPAAHQLADYERAVLPGTLAEGVAGAQLAIHVAFFGGVALTLALVHLGLAGGPARVRLADSFPGGWRRLRGHLALAAGSWVVGVALLSVAFPAPVAQPYLPWPFAPFGRLAEAAATPLLFAVAGFGVWGLLVIQPWIAGRRGLVWASRGLYLAAVGLTFAAR